ncbi:MAG TPA: Fic family protein [Rhizomicrobium sp.]|nr:Fic family protein [Rhizomicrobium sp.]
MRFPAIPPNPDKLFEALLKNKKKMASLEPLRRLVVELPYDHWDKMRFRPVPEPFSPQDLWAIAKMNRRFSRRELPFLDTKGDAFGYVATGEFQRALHEIDSHARGMIGVSGAAASSEGRDVYLQKSLIEEPFSSSVLEGAATTREIARKMIEEARQPKTLGERMVLNNYEAMVFVREHRDEPMTPARILEIHRILTKDTLSRPEKCGVLRAPDDDVRVVDAITGETLHSPPPADELTDRLQKLCDLANAALTDGEFLHPIIRAVLLHFQLAYDHPFWDGNGRTARALFYWCVLRHGYWLLEYVSISAVIMRAPLQYGTAFLYTETDECDVTYFINHQLEVIEKSIADLHAYLAKKAEELRALAKTLGILQRLLNHRQLPLIQHALKHNKSRYTIADHGRLHGVSYLTARTDLEALARMGFLKKTKEGVQSVFLVPENLSERLERRAAA